jgi:uncharacterized protein
VLKCTSSEPFGYWVVFKGQGNRTVGKTRNQQSDLSEIVRVAKARFGLDIKGIHGISHWERVRENGHKIAKQTGVEPVFIDLFAYLHDCCREDDRSDTGHGERAAEFAKTLRGSLIRLEDSAFQLLYEAIRDHELGFVTGDIVKRTCWDADRLDLGRIMIRPNPKLLCTDFAKRPATINWAFRKSRPE